MDTITLNELDKLTKGCEEIPTPEESIIPTKLEGVEMEPENKYDVSSIIKIIELLGEAKKAYKKVMEDKKVSVGDIPTAIGFGYEVVTAIPSLTDLPNELKDTFTAEETDQIVDALINADYLSAEDEEKADKAAKIIADIKNFVFQYIVK